MKRVIEINKDTFEWSLQEDIMDFLRQNGFYQVDGEPSDVTLKDGYLILEIST